MLSNALEGTGISLPAGSDVPLPLAETTGHTWVEMQNGATWVDLDPTLPATAPGTILTRPSETLDQLPDDLHYGVEFDVLVERDQGGQLVTDNALSYSGFADELAGVPVTFGHVTPSGLQSLGIAVSNLLGGGWLDYRPTLNLGGRSIVANLGVAFPAAGGASGLFGGQSSPGASLRDGEATAEWLEVRVTQPGGQPELARRTIFDRLPAELRATGQLTPGAVEPIELVDPNGTGSSDFLPMLGTETFAIATGPTSPAPVVGNFKDVPGMLALTYHDLRDAMDAELALDAGARTFVDGPNIVSVSLGIHRAASGPEVHIGLDIWRRSHGVLPLTGTSVSVAQAELIAGVTDQIAERFALDDITGTQVALHPAISVGDVFDAASTQGIATLVFHGAIPDSLPYGPGATELIRDAVAAGDVVVIPAKPVTIGGSERVGWWTIDPRTGVTTDEMDDAAGQEMIEEDIQLNGDVRAIACFGPLAARAVADIAFVASLFGSLEEIAVWRFWNQGAAGTRCVAL